MENTALLSQFRCNLRVDHTGAHFLQISGRPLDAPEFGKTLRNWFVKGEVARSFGTVFSGCPIVYGVDAHPEFLLHRIGHLEVSSLFHKFRFRVNEVPNNESVIMIINTRKKANHRNI
jgi:hypothetical protein